jgi:hypothetical protein
MRHVGYTQLQDHGPVVQQVGEESPLLAVAVERVPASQRCTWGTRRACQLPFPPGEHYPANHPRPVLHDPGDGRREGRSLHIAHPHPFKYGVRRENPSDGTTKCLDRVPQLIIKIIFAYTVWIAVGQQDLSEKTEHGLQ